MDTYMLYILNNRNLKSRFLVNDYTLKKVLDTLESIEQHLNSISDAFNFQVRYENFGVDQLNHYPKPYHEVLTDKDISKIGLTIHLTILNHSILYRDIDFHLATMPKIELYANGTGRASYKVQLGVNYLPFLHETLLDCIQQVNLMTNLGINSYSAFGEVFANILKSKVEG